MQSFFESNPILFLSSYVVALFAWILVSRLSNIRVRKALRASIIFVKRFFPIIEISHPFLFYQVWMGIVMCILLEFTSECFVLLFIWFIVIVASQREYL